MTSVATTAVLWVSAPIALNGNQEWSGALVADQLDIAGYTLTTAGASTDYSLQVTALSGAGAIVKNDQGVLAPVTAAGYTGSITANAGVLSSPPATGSGRRTGPPRPRR